MGKRKKYNSIKKVSEIMEEMDTPCSENYDLTERFQKNGASAPPGPQPSRPLIEAFTRTFEPASSESLAQELFTMGRLREYFQAWIVPKMPDPLTAYLDELSAADFYLRTSFDGTPCIMVRYRGAVEVRAEEVEAEECSPCDATPTEVPVYTDDWEDDLSDIEPPEFEE